VFIDIAAPIAMHNATAASILFADRSFASQRLPHGPRRSLALIIAETSDGLILNRMRRSRSASSVSRSDPGIHSPSAVSPFHLGGFLHRLGRLALLRVPPCGCSTNGRSSPSF
jgi:hypothetical protein